MSKIQKQQSRYRFLLPLATMVLLACTVVGCGESGGSGSVSGKVSFKGQPVVHGDVTFFQPSSGRVAQAALDSEGNYSLDFSQKSLPPGEFKVTVTPEISYVEVNGPNGKDMKMVFQGGETIPKRYRGRKSTRLSATITGGEDSFDFDLE